MNVTVRFASNAANAVFSPSARQVFAARYPETPHTLRHDLSRHDLLTLDAIARLGETLPAHCAEYNRGDCPIGVGEKPAATGLSIGDTIRGADGTNSWAVLKNIEQDPAYSALLTSLLGEIRPEIEAKTGPMLLTQGFIFVSSPNAVTPYHFDPEHNILLQLAGHKVMTQFTAGNTQFAADTAHETYHTGGARELAWSDDFIAGGREFPLGPGDALYVPVMAPHFVRNGPATSISLSITWRSKWSYAEADSRAFNHALRKFGLAPRPPGRWPASNRVKSIAARTLRRAGYRL
ncbi:JmjC domain-containing protein [Altererythrobacter aquiaggeris]|uniref:JmjC domain-containing protein n=1 Tax=Aestuarierythrobacter aquiaggeris TaxID=1898396 RepID=UPI00301B146A